MTFESVEAAVAAVTPHVPYTAGEVEHAIRIIMKRGASVEAGVAVVQYAARYGEPAVAFAQEIVDWADANL